MAKKTIKDRNNKAIAPATRSDMVFRQDHKSIDEVMLVTEPQELTSEQKNQVQANIGVKDTVDVVGVGEVREILLEIAKDDMRRNPYGIETQTTGAFISTPIEVKRGDILVFNTKSTINYCLLAEVDADNNFISLLITGLAGENNYYYIVNKDAFVSFSSSKPSFAVKIKFCNLAGFLAEPAGGYPEDLYKAAGATRDEIKGVWLLNGLELTNEEMAEVYRVTNGFFSYQPNPAAYANTNIRTNILNNSIYTIINGKYDLLNMFRESIQLEVIAFNKSESYPIRVTSLVTAFYKCSKLRKVDTIDMNECTTPNGTAQAFDGCSALETISLKNCKINVSFKDSPLLSVEDTTDSTLGYLVENAANTTPITVTLHADAYAKVPESLKQKAQEKQISFATA